ncbi:MAG: VPLPA-CTERM sorting domain-containing protein [Desulfobacteraceae bacterium]|nr:VPLPA-CTERM sorting domain-containing protein [Desulfobacteraceae bacterium]
MVSKLFSQKKYLVMVAIVLLLSVSGLASATPVKWSGNVHYYDYISGGYTWESAFINAGNRTHNGIEGYLATLTSADENSFVWSNFSITHSFIGGYQAANNGAWTWITGEAWTWDNWASGEPNNGGSGANEDFIQFAYTGGGQWNDINSTWSAGYIIEYAPVPLPGAIWLLGSGLIGLAGLKRRK